MTKRLSLLFTLALLTGAVSNGTAADIVGRASMGASGGGMLFLSGDNFGNGEPRFIGRAVFKYNFSERFAGVLESGWGWNAFPGATEAQDTLVTVVPTTLGLEYRSRFGETSIWPHLGVGAGLYALGVKDSFRTWASAGDAVKRLTWTSPGFYGKLGAEYLFENNVSMNVDLVYHQIFSSNDEYAFTPIEDDTDPERPNFSNTWGVENTSFAEFRLGVNYYFTIKKRGGAVPDAE